MLDSKALRVKMVESECSVADLAKILGISTTAVYRRLNNEVAFTVPEMLKCVSRLNLSTAERDKIFFEKKVS